MNNKYLNGGFIFASIINYLALTFLMGLIFNNLLYGLAAALPVLILLYALVQTPLTDKYYRYKLELREPNERELKRIKSAWNMVVSGANDCGVKIPPALKIYVKDANDLNVCAAGKNTIAIHTAMLVAIIQDEEIAGVLGHELGHIVHGDTVRLLMSLQGSNMLNIIYWLYKAVAWIVEYMFRILFTLLGFFWSDGNVDCGILLGKIVGGMCAIPGKIIDLVGWGISRIETVGYMWFSRQDEFAVDQFSTSIGLGKGLKDSLARISYNEKVNKFSLEYILKGTHPPTSERIEHIEILMRQMESRKQKRLSENTDDALMQTDTAAEIVNDDSERYSAEEQFRMAMQCIKKGERQQGILWLKKAAAQDYLKAHIELGKCYLYGIGVKANKSKAAHYLQKALEIGDAEGIYLLAECYASVGGDKKYAEAAFRCYRKSASLGCTAAIAKAGLCFLDGNGTQKNEKTAFDWLKMAVEKRNYQKAAYPLAKCYIQGIGTQKDIGNGIKTLQRGIASGCDDADKAKQLLRDCTLHEHMGDDSIQDLLDMLDD